MLEVLEAIEKLRTSRSDLAVGLVGGVSVGFVPKGRARPYLVIVPPESTEPEYDTEKASVEPDRFSFHFFGTKLSDVKPIALAWRNALRFQGLPLATGDLILATLKNEGAVYEESSDEQEAAAWHYILDFEFLHQQTI